VSDHVNFVLILQEVPMTIRSRRAPSIFALTLRLTLLVAVSSVGLISYSPVKAARGQSQCATPVSVKANAIAVSESGGVQTININTPYSQQYPWTAIVEADAEEWITFVGAANGAGKAALQIRVAPNASGALCTAQLPLAMAATITAR
jgi:hypothetical protein